MKNFLLGSLLSLIPFSGFAQDQHLVDSLKTLLKTSTEDTIKANLLYAISKAHWGSHPDTAISYANQTLDLSNKIGYKKGIGNAYVSIGAIEDDKGNYPQALESYSRAAKIFEDIRYMKGIATASNNIGLVYMEQGNYPEALQSFLTSLKIKEEIGDKAGIGNGYNNIGNIYKNEGNYPEALKYYHMALKIREETGNKKGIADSYNSIGIILSNQGNYPKALENFTKALTLKEETGDKQGTAFSHSNMGDVYTKQGNYPDALKKYITALNMTEEMGDMPGIAYMSTSIGKIYTRQHRYEDAGQFLQKGLSLSKEIGLLDNIKETYTGLAVLDSMLGNYKQALEYYKLFISYRDSLLNKENTQKITQLQMQYDFDKKQAADSLKFAQEKEISALMLQRQKAITYTGFTGVALTLLFLFLVYRSYQKQRLANTQLKQAQADLIKSEKMAAFGVMASRVSHEILNPLNFINNFSELSQEVVEEVIASHSEADKNKNAAVLIGNLQKIHEHGRRATEIVKQLQEHTRKGSAHEFFEENKG